MGEGHRNKGQGRHAGRDGLEPGGDREHGQRDTGYQSRGCAQGATVPVGQGGSLRHGRRARRQAEEQEKETRAKGRPQGEEIQRVQVLGITTFTTPTGSQFSIFFFMCVYDIAICSLTSCKFLTLNFFSFLSVIIHYKIIKLLIK